MRRLRRSVARAAARRAGAVVDRLARVHTDDRGAISVLAAGSMVAVIAASAMGVDSGRMMLFDRELQQVVDNAVSDGALALATRYDELCGQHTSFTPAARQCLEDAVTEVVNEAALRNANYAERVAAGDLGPIELEFGHVLPGSPGSNPVFVPQGQGIPSSIRATIDGTIDYVFLPGDRSFLRDGVAQGLKLCNVDLTPQLCGPTPGNDVLPSGTVSLGSALLAVDDTLTSTVEGEFNGLSVAATEQINAVLPAMFGISPATLDLGSGASAVGYGSLAAAEVDLVAVLAELCHPALAPNVAGTAGVSGGSVGGSASAAPAIIATCQDALSAAGGVTTVVANPDSLLGAEVSLADLATATANALEREGGATGLQAVTPLRTLAANASNQLRFTFGELFQVESGHGKALGGTFNVADLLSQAAQVANGTNVVAFTQDVTLPGAGPVGVPATVTTEMTVIEPPVTYTGPAGPEAIARTAQVAVQQTISLLDGALVVPLFVEGASATANLSDVQCTLPLRASYTDAPSTVSGVLASLGTDADLTSPGFQQSVSAGPVRFDASATTGAGGTSADVGGEAAGAATGGSTDTTAAVGGVTGTVGAGVDETVETVVEAAPLQLLTVDLLAEPVIGPTTAHPVDFPSLDPNIDPYGPDDVRTIGTDGFLGRQLLTEATITSPTAGTLLGRDVGFTVEDPFATIEGILQALNLSFQPRYDVSVGLEAGGAQIDGSLDGTGPAIAVSAPSLYGLLDTIEQELVEPTFAALGVSLGQARVSSNVPGCDTRQLKSTDALQDPGSVVPPVVPGDIVRG